MKKMIFFNGYKVTLLIFVLFTFSPNVYLQNPKRIKEGTIRVKFKEEYTRHLDYMNQMPRLKSADGVLLTGLKSIDNLNKQFKVDQIRRIFPPAGKFEKKHRKHGLHLWYEISVNKKSGIHMSSFLASYKDDPSIHISEYVYDKKIVDAAESTRGAPSPSLATSDPLYLNQWHYENTGQTSGRTGADIKLEEAWNVETGDSSVIVAVIDGGIEYTHEDLAAAMWVNREEYWGLQGVDDDNNGYIDDIHGYGFGDGTAQITPHYHGTHVAGTIGAITNNGIGVSGIAGGSGNADGVRLMSCATFGAYNSDGFEEAFVYAADNGAVIAQNSWGYTSPGYVEQSVLDAIDYFIANAGYDENGQPVGPMQGGIVIFAAGNDGTNEEWYPGFYEHVLSVASTNHLDQKSWYSNYGPWVDISAPGGETSVMEQGVLSTYTGNSYHYLQGTSMACPHVSGVAGLIVSKYKNNGLTPQLVWNLLVQNTDTIDQYNAGYEGLLGSGRLNALAALQPNDSIPPHPITDLLVIDSGVVSITLRWTATGCSADSGRASMYDIRVADFLIDSTNFEQATRVLNIPCPSTSGTTETFDVTGLNPQTTYYFAIKAADYFRYTSLLSNVVMATTKDAPSIVVTPVSLHQRMDSSNISESNVVIENTGMGELYFEFPEYQENPDPPVPNPSFILDIISPADTLQSGGNSIITLRFSSSSMEPGNYLDSLFLVTNDPFKSALYIPIYLHINGIPQIGADQSHISFPETYVNVADFLPITIQNTGSDSLFITDIITSNSVFYVNEQDRQFRLYKNESKTLPVFFDPVEAVNYTGDLAIRSNSPIDSILSLTLSGTGLIPPVIEVSPDSLNAELFTSDSLVQQITIANTGGSDLRFQIEIVEPEEDSLASFVISQSNTFHNNKRVAFKDEKIPETGPSDIYRLNDYATSDVSIASMDKLEDVLSSLQDSYHYITDIIPNRFDFYDGIYGSSIYDGGSDMYDRGNYLSTNMGSYLPYSDKAIQSSNLLGSSGKYFTAKFPGLFIMAADINNISYFHISGNLGADGMGNVDGAVLNIKKGTTEYLGFVKRVYNANDPSVNHLIIVPKNPDPITHEFSTHSADDYHKVINLDNSQRIYYLLFAGQYGSYMDNVSVLTIMQHFIDVIDPGPDWLSIDYDRDTLAPGSSAELSVTYNATSLLSGDYYANILISNNDPLHNLSSIPVHMHVTGKPDIQVSTDTIVFPKTFVDDFRYDTITVFNEGTDSLIVYDITSNNADITVDTAQFVLKPDEQIKVPIQYNPGEAGTDTGSLSIYSNDSGNLITTVFITGTGILPPKIQVSPDSLSAALYSGDTVTKYLTIDNTEGESELIYQITKKQILNATHQHFQASGSEVPSTLQSDDRPVTKPLVPGDSSVLVIQNTSAWGVYMYNFLSSDFGISATVINSYQIPSTDFSNFDLVITVGDENSDYYSAISENVSKFEEYVYHGGTVQYQLATNGSNVNIVNQVNVMFGNYEEFNTALLPDHPILTGLPEQLEGNYANHCYLTNLPGNAQILTETSSTHLPTTAEYSYGQGRVIVTGMTWEHVYSYAYNSADLMPNAIDYVLSSTGVNWLTVKAFPDTIPAGTSEEVPVIFNADGKYGGDYRSTIMITSNDPANPEVQVQAHMHVTGAPNIQLSTDSLDFGQAFIHIPLTDTLVVSNSGTDTLHVINIISNDLHFTIDTTRFDLLPEEFIPIFVHYTPGHTEINEGILSFFSNDSSNLMIQVMLKGVGILPPKMEVTPDSLMVSSKKGRDVTTYLTIDNSGGGSDLNYAIVENYLFTPSSGLAISKPSQNMPIHNQTAKLVANAIDVQYYSPAFLYQQIHSMYDLNILVLEAVSDHYYYDHALNNLGFSRTLVTDADYFEQQLTNGTRWDLVIYNSYTSSMNNSLLDEMNSYMLNGGKLIMADWSTNDYASHLLFENMGVNSINGILEPINFTASQPSHPIFNNNNDISNLYWTDNQHYTDGQITEALPGASGIASYDGYPGSDAIVINALESTIFNAFQAVNFNGDHDSDGKLDMVELIENEISYLLSDYFWLSIDIQSGSISSGTYQEIAVTCNAENLQPGEYHAHINISTNDPENSLVIVPVTFIVEEQEPPVVVNPLPNQQTYITKDTIQLNLAGVFHDPDDETLWYNISSAYPDIAIPVIENNTVIFDLKGVGEGWFTVSASDGYNDPVSTSFSLLVQENNSPIQQAELKDILLKLPGDPVSIDLDTVFHDPDSDPMTFTISATDESIVTASLEGTELTLTPQKIGSSDVVIHTNDNKSSDLLSSFNVEVIIVTSLNNVKPGGGINLRNIPNPFHEKTYFVYHLPTKEKVTIHLFTLDGNLLKTVLDEKQTPGEKWMEVDGTGLTPGIYIYKLFLGNILYETGKLVKE